MCSRCWATNPAKRPTSTEVLRTLCSLAQTEFPDLEWNLPSLPRDPPSSETTTERKQRQRIPCQTIHLPKFDPLTADKPPSWFKVTLKNSGNLSLILKTLPVMRTAISQDHKVSCSAIFRNYLWLGSQNGGLAVLDTDDGEISLASDYLFAEGRSSFRAMSFSVVNHIVWTGNERGLIQVYLFFHSFGFCLFVSFSIFANNLSRLGKVRLSQGVWRQKISSLRKDPLRFAREIIPFENFNLFLFNSFVLVSTGKETTSTTP